MSWVLHFIADHLLGDDNELGVSFDSSSQFSNFTQF